MASNLIPSNDVKNRILAWLIVLHKVREALAAATCIWELAATNPMSEEYWCQYSSGGNQSSVQILYTAHNALYTQAIILFFQIFTSGSAGLGIASNNHNAIKIFRKEMRVYAIAELGWDEARYDAVINFVKNQRHQFTAHYDGQAAQYEETVPGSIYKMKSPGVHMLQPQELSDFTKVATVLQLFVRSELIKSGP